MLGVADCYLNISCRHHRNIFCSNRSTQDRKRHAPSYHIFQKAKNLSAHPPELKVGDGSETSARWEASFVFRCRDFPLDLQLSVFGNSTVLCYLYVLDP